jgi:hypothetical protein
VASTDTAPLLYTDYRNNAQSGGSKTPGKQRTVYEEGYGRGAKCFGVGTDAPLVNAIPALSRGWGFCICVIIKGVCAVGDLAVFSVLKRVADRGRFSIWKRPRMVSESQILSIGC